MPGFAAFSRGFREDYAVDPDARESEPGLQLSTQELPPTPGRLPDSLFRKRVATEELTAGSGDNADRLSSRRSFTMG